MRIKDLSRDELVGLAQQTYEKNEWTQDDLGILRSCWNEFEQRGGENAVMFFRPAFFGVLKVHEIETGEVDEEFIRMLEPSQIAQDYREIIRKLDGMEVKHQKELEQEITRWRNVQQNLSDIGAYYAVSGVPVLPGGQLPQEDVLALIDLVQSRLDEFAWQADDAKIGGSFGIQSISAPKRLGEVKM